MLASAPPAKDGRPEQILSELSNDLMSPYCPGRTIASCPSEQARKLEDHILAEAQAGKSRTEIEQDLVATFGQEIVGYAPQPMLLYGVAAAGIAGLMLVAWVGRKWMRARAPLTAAAAGVPAGTAAAAAGSSPKTRGPSAAERERLEDALDDLDEF